MIGSGWIHRHIGRSDDYSPANSNLSQLRKAGWGEAGVGAGVGATLGATAGFGWGMHNLLHDRVEVSSQRVEVTAPRLVGAHFEKGWAQVMPGPDLDGHPTTTTIYHPDQWSPVIVHEPTGQTYVRQEFHHSLPFGPVAGTLVGLGAGAVLGGVTGALMRALRPPEQSEGGPVDTGLASLGDRAPLYGLAAGGTLGAAAGALVGHVSQAQGQTLSQLIREPVLERRSIGYLPPLSQYPTLKPLLDPNGHLSYQRFAGEPFRDGHVVQADVPTGRFSERNLTQSSSWLNPVSGALVGLGAGALTGLAAGVATGLLLKSASGEKE